SYWIYDTIDYYIAPCQEVKQELIDKGVINDKIKVLGIPVDPGFSKQVSTEEIIRKLELKQDLPKILVMGGGQGLGPISSLVSILDQIDLNLEILVVTGINRKLYHRIKNRISSFKHRVKVFEFVDNIAELMSVSELIITKAGGITTAEALVKGLPMIIVKPLPGQEMSNTRYLIAKGAALCVENIKDIRSVVKEMLLNKEKLNRMRQSARLISMPHSSIDIANLIIELSKNNGDI
ncbi:MAG: DUF354 domain-containing protein, partial [Candidatus Omnitrophica bacterium]|nr:DUF354 domain-containing protein [Candidatus Omnitrophota bacterium]